MNFHWYSFGKKGTPSAYPSRQQMERFIPNRKRFGSSQGNGILLEFTLQRVYGFICTINRELQRMLNPFSIWFYPILFIASNFPHTTGLSFECVGTF